MYKSQGKYKAAEPLFLEDLEISRELLGDRHPYVATSLNNLALLYSSQGKYEAAELLYLQALEICEESLGIKHPTTSIVRGNYDYLLQQKKSE